jgi:hypothetical protein
MEDEAFGRFAQTHRHIERLDRQVFLYSVADRPANNASATQVEDYG